MPAAASASREFIITHVIPTASRLAKRSLQSFWGNETEVNIDHRCLKTPHLSGDFVTGDHKAGAVPLLDGVTSFIKLATA